MRTRTVSGHGLAAPTSLGDTRTATNRSAQRAGPTGIHLSDAYNMSSWRDLYSLDLYVCRGSISLWVNGADGHWWGKSALHP